MTQDFENIKGQIKRDILIADLLRENGIEVFNGNKFSNPFRVDKHPSCVINVKENYWKDFSIDDGGNVIDLYMRLHNIDFADAFRELAGRCGYNLDENTSVKHDSGKRSGLRTALFASIINQSARDCLSGPEREKYKRTLSNLFPSPPESVEIGGKIYNDFKQAEAEILKTLRLKRIRKNKEIFVEFLDYCHMHREDAPAAYKYLSDERKLPLRLLNEFFITAVGNYFAVHNHMKKIFEIDDLKRSGLFNEKGNLVFAKHRIIIPYMHGRYPIYVRGRYFDENGNTKPENAGKYFGLKNDALEANSAKRFFNFNAAVKALPGEKIYIVEGEFDAIALSGLGYNAIAVPGVGNMPADYMFRRLLSFEIVICVDTDEPGEGLQHKLIEKFEQLNKPVKIKKMPGKDINEFVAG